MELFNQNEKLNSLSAKLIERNHKPLDTGELVLLARAITDCIPLKNCDLLAKDIININSYAIQDIINYINNYTYINQDQEKILYECMEGFLSWRINLINEPKDPLFVSGDNYFVDEMSLLTRFIDAGLLCSVCSIYNNAQYTYKLFKDIVKELNSLNIFKEEKR